MEITNLYYKDVNFLNIIYANDITIMKHFADLFFDGDMSRVIYASNAYAFRKRANKNEGNLNLPFINVYLNGYMPGVRQRWNGPMYSQGTFISELQQKIRYAPITLDYEASFWCHTDFDVKFAFSEFVWDTDNKTILAPSVELLSHDISLPAHLSYDGLDLDPEYNETDWLERNKIHSASIDFQLETLALKSNDAINIPEKVLFNFVQSKGADVGGVEESYEYLVSELS
jgi:hypothetical protein